MDHVFDPNGRKWISPLTHLGDSMEKLKHLVRLQKESLVVLDPTVSTCSTPKSQRDSQHPTLALEYPGYVSGFTVEEQALILQSKIDKLSANKWSTSETECAAAVAAVGGPNFFKPDKSKDANSTVLGAPVTAKKRQRKSRKTGTTTEANVTLQDVKTEENGDFNANNSNASGEGLVKDPTNIYEQFNYGPSVDMKIEEDELLLNETIDEAELRKILQTIPAALDESDDEEETDWLTLDNAIDNFSSAAERYEFFKGRYRDLLDSDDEDEDEHEVNSSEDEAEPPAMGQYSDDTGFGSGPATQSTEPGPSKPVLVAEASRKRPGLRSAGKVLADIKQEPELNQDTSAGDAKTDGATLAGIKIENEQSDQSGVPKNANTEKTEGPTDFKKFTDWALNQSKTRDDEYKKRIRPDLMKKLGRFEKVIADFQRVTNATLTSVKGEVFQDDPVMKSASMPVLAPPIEGDVTLQSLAIFLTHGEDPSRFPWKSVNVQQQMNDDFAHDKFLKRMEQQKIDIRNPALAADLVKKQDDFLVQVLIYQATDPDEILPDEVKMFIEPKLAYELCILGSQTVGDLMKAIHCENDYVYLKEVDHPESFVEDLDQYAKNKFPTSLILINDTIYHDQKADTVDYVSVVNEWAKKQPEKKIGQFKSGDFSMQMKDVELRFGYPYVYIHLGSCEHIIVFTKARLLHAEDEHLIKSYPKINSVTRFKNIYCRVDNEYLARWAVLDYKEFPENPMLLCTECVLMYCYDKQKKKVKRGNFRLYPFTQLANIL